MSRSAQAAAAWFLKMGQPPRYLGHARNHGQPKKPNTALPNAAFWARINAADKKNERKGARRLCEWQS